MRVTRIHLEGFRNFQNATISLSEKCLIIGANDVGKSNLLYALRLLLDKDLPESALEPSASDFYAFEDTTEMEIVLEFQDVREDCVLSKMREHVSDDGKLFLVYRGRREPIGYQLLAGRALESLQEIQSRYYLRVLSLKFAASRRDVYDFVRRERRALLQDAKAERTRSEVEADLAALAEIDEGIDQINTRVRNLTYVGKATESLNEELAELSYHNVTQEVVLDAGAADPAQFVDDLRLASQIKGKRVLVGGDGRNNQIHLALWAARNRIGAEEGGEPSDLKLFCIEEPEAHLHPHQQRRLAQYLAGKLKGQVILTSHSPQIACEFSPSSIVRLHNPGDGARAAGGGINPFTETALIDFGFRLNVIPAEAFFADVVLLVEGVSEVLFYKGLAQQIGVDLDKLNISVLPVDGVGFRPYVSLLRSLEIPFVVRTDNDVFAVPRQDRKRLAGIQRAIEICQLARPLDTTTAELMIRAKARLGSVVDPMEPAIRELAQGVISELQRHDVFLAKKDLETDFYRALSGDLEDYLGVAGSNEVIERMQQAKGTFMFDFLQKRCTSLGKLRGHALASPLLRCMEIAENQYETTAHPRTATDS